MDTRLLYTIALVIVAVVGGFYYYSGKSDKLQATNSNNLNSTAKNIQVVQTNERGELYAKATVANMTQWMQDERAELHNIQGTLYQHNQPNSTFKADRLLARNQYKDVDLQGNIVVAQYSAEQQVALQFKTNSLQGDLTKNKLSTKDTVYITHPQGQFVSQGLDADLNSGQYDFFKIRGMYVPVQ